MAPCLRRSGVRSGLSKRGPREIKQSQKEKNKEGIFLEVYSPPLLPGKPIYFSGQLRRLK